jgi:hypothetical protein
MSTAHAPGNAQATVSVWASVGLLAHGGQTEGAHAPGGLAIAAHVPERRQRRSGALYMLYNMCEWITRLDPNSVFEKKQFGDIRQIRQKWNSGRRFHAVLPEPENFRKAMGTCHVKMTAYCFLIWKNLKIKWP